MDKDLLQRVKLWAKMPTIPDNVPAEASLLLMEAQRDVLELSNALLTCESSNAILKAATQTMAEIAQKRIAKGELELACGLVQTQSILVHVEGQRKERAANACLPPRNG